MLNGAPASGLRSEGSLEPTDMRVLRVYHAGRSTAQRNREAALSALGVDVALVVPSSWSGPEHAEMVSESRFQVIELDVARAGDVNRHRYTDRSAIARVIAEVRPDVLDVHEEPFSASTHQWLGAAPGNLPITLYSAQNIDKRFPPPFSRYERRALRRAAGLYPCSRQAASVARTKGFTGITRVIPLGFDSTLFVPGGQSLNDSEIVLGLFGRLVPEKGVVAAVRVLARVVQARPARLLLVGDGPEAANALSLASRLGVRDRVEWAPWRNSVEVSALLRNVHVVLAPSSATPSWVEQFGRVIVEAQAAGAVVAAYATGSIPEVGGRAALLVADADIDGLSQGVVSLIHDPDDWSRRRGVGVEQAAGRTWTRVAEDQLDLYHAVLANPTPARSAKSRSDRRRAAIAEFGPSAATPAGPRPFALPPLDRAGRLPTLVGAVVDRVERVASRLPTAGRARY